MTLLDVQGLSVDYGGRQAVRDLSFTLAPREALALVGESGCGKSTTALALTGLLPAGAVRQGVLSFQGQDLAALPPRAMRRILGRDIGMIFQEPMTALNPVHSIGAQIIEVLQAHEAIGRRAARARAVELLELVALPDPQRRVDAYPHELSGGQRQRAMIAAAIALNPRLLIADEPTTALDATVQLQILTLLDRLRRDLGMALLLISHDLAVVSRWTDRVLVMHAGRRMEELPSPRLFEAARHDYTRGLIGASLRLTDNRHYTTTRLPEVESRKSADGATTFALRAAPPPAPRPERSADPLLQVQDLTLRHGGQDQPAAVDGVSFTLSRGETLGLVGESGSGKSSLARAVLRLQDAQSGQIRFDGQDITALRPGPLRALRSRMQMVFQDPHSSLNPRKTVADTLGAVLAAHGHPRGHARVIGQALSVVGLPQTAAARYPHEFSGGQRQRIAIARAIILKPKLVVCDEAVSALDVSIQAQILNLLADMKAEFGLSYLFISHDLGVVRYFCDRVMVMRSGRILETGQAGSLWRAPAHPYTRQLVEAAG